MIVRHVARPKSGPFKLKRPTHLTWSKVNEPAHVDGLCAYSPFAARYGLFQFGPLASFGQSNIIRACCYFWPMYGP